MAKLLKPALFSAHTGVVGTHFDKAGLIDPILNCDTKLFVDPLLVGSSSHKGVKAAGYKLLKERFDKIVRLVAASKRERDAAWKAAENLLSLDERPETCLGYGGSGISGQRRPDSIKQQVLRTAKEIVELGESDPEIISLMGMFEEGVGPDTISDLTTTVIMPALAKITASFCKQHGITTKRFGEFELPENPYRAGAPVILVPKDIVRDLPLAADWSDVSAAALESKEIRDSFNSFIGKIAQSTLVERKAALKRVALSSLEKFRQIFKAVLEASEHYDPNADVLNYYSFRKLMGSKPAAFKAGISQGEPGKEELRRIVLAIIGHFRQMVEHNNLWELLWDGERPKRERAAQLLFFGVADMFCRANNIDISPETNMGGGPVDFKFSSGYARRLLVEIKLSKGTVVHGYEKQLEIYKAAADTDEGVFVVVQVGALGGKMKAIQGLRERRLERKEPSSTIELIDGRKKKSASTR